VRPPSRRAGRVLRARRSLQPLGFKMELKINLSFDDNYSITEQVVVDTVSHLENVEKTDYVETLINLLKEIKREIQRIENSKSDLSLTSIHIRNIFELFLISKYVFSDNKAFSSWLGQLHKDTSDVIDGFITLFDKFGKDIPDLKEYKQFIDSTLEDSEYSSKGTSHAGIRG
jgi:DNA-binding MltR family transcriptional regulator